MRQSGLEGAALAWAGRLLAAAVASATLDGLEALFPTPWFVAAGRLPFGVLIVALDPPLGRLEPLDAERELAAVPDVAPLFGFTATAGRELTALPLIGAALALARVVLLADELGEPRAVGLMRG